MARILMVASEAAPFAKTGGLADVLGALPPALVEVGHEVAVVLPHYRSIGTEQARRVWDNLDVAVGSNVYPCTVFERRLRNVSFYFLNCPILYDRAGGLYGEAGKNYSDNHLRFAALCMGALGVARNLFNPDILHLHDWQAALAAVYPRTRLNLDPAFIGLKTVFTIHNMEHQGRFSRAEFNQLGLPATLFRRDLLEFYGDLNMMKGGILFADAITTVSPRYAREIQTPEFGFGLDGLILDHADKVTGILNGVDYGEWSPEHDPLIAAPYSVDNLSGKRLCKHDLLAEMGLSEENRGRPVLGIVSRLARQKGFNLLAEIAGELMKEDVCLAVLGSGEPEYEEFFRSLQELHPDRVGLHVGYNNQLAHKIEAGSDLFLMPSLFEPCGLNQMYSLRYGTVPVVRATGGLDDSVQPDTGFKFEGYDPGDFLEQIRAALAEWSDQVVWQKRMRRGMLMDFSWTSSAKRYSDLYASLMG